MKRFALTALVILAMTLSVGVSGMNNYDDPRISTGFFDEEMAGALDILKVTLRAKENIEANIYLRDMSDVPFGEIPGYLFSLRQGGQSRDWLVLQKDGHYKPYRITSSRIVHDHKATVFELEAHKNDVMRLHNDRITLNFALDNINYAQDLEYDVSTTLGNWNGSSFVVKTWQDNLSNERITTKIIKPLQLFNTLCAGRS